MKRCLLIQTSFIGDVVLASSMLETLHRSDQRIQLDLLVRKGNESLFNGHPYLNELLIWDKKSGKYKNLIRLLGKIRATKYDLVINLQRFAGTGFLAAFSGAKEIVGYDKNPFSFLFTRKVKHSIGVKGESVHEIDRCHALLANLVKGPAMPPKLYPSTADYNRVAVFQQVPYVVIAPGSVWFTKQFPIEKWIPVLNSLPDDFPVYVIGAPSDSEKAQFIKDQLPGKNIQILTGKLSFLESAALMEKAQLNLVNDSAPLHFASARNAPTLAIFCSTVPAFGFGPLSSESYIIETRVPLSCRPCGLHGKKACPEGHFNCGQTINESEISDILRTKLKKCIPEQV